MTESPSRQPPTTQPTKGEDAKDASDCFSVGLRLGLAGKSVVVSVPRDQTVSDLRMHFARAAAEFDHGMVLILGDRVVHNTEKLSDLRQESAEQLGFTAVHDSCENIRTELKRFVRRFDARTVGRLMAEGDPDCIEELFGQDLEKLYLHNDAIIDRLDVEVLKDLEAFYRLKRHCNLHIRCLSCCSNTGPACVVWDLDGEMHIIGQY
ncbi:unnamed protein product [Symbiodinium natans]|uniref:Uncharacterized protein n=1 Tax=Symbiodinium natans TaxID=878477 RepID=A0A812L8W8_9DINO|nr:unnamed protein product [Symbiodinium natans]